MSNSLIDNAVLSIQIGVEDFESDENGRTLSAVRNIYAGVLLLCKEVLSRLSPAGSDSVLIKARIEPEKQADGTVQFVGKGRNTVDRKQIEERFRSLGLTLDWQRLGRLGRIRNDIEHYFTNETEALIKEAAAEAFLLIRAIIVEHLEEEPVNLLGDETWKVLLETSGVFEEERQACEQSFAKVSFRSDILENALSRLACPACGSSLLKQADPDNEDQDDIDLVCSACGDTPDTGDVFETAIEEELAAQLHLSEGQRRKSPRHLSGMRPEKFPRRRGHLRAL